MRQFRYPFFIYKFKNGFNLLNAQGIFMNKFDIFYVDNAMPTTSTTTTVVTVSPSSLSKHCSYDI